MFFSTTTFVWCAVCCFVVVVIVALIYKATESMRKQQADSARQEVLREQCNSIHASETLFVCMTIGTLSEMHTKNEERLCYETTWNLCQLFVNAFCPYRIRVGITAEKNLGVKLKSYLASETVKAWIGDNFPVMKEERLFGWINNSSMVQINSLPHYFTTTRPAALMRGYQELYKQELYSLLLDNTACYSFEENWEQTIITELQHRQSYDGGGTRKPIVSFFPSWRQGPPTFSVIHELDERTGFPVLAQRDLYNTPVTSYTQLFCLSTFCFTYSVAFKDIHVLLNCFTNEMEFSLIDDHVFDYIFSVALFMKGWDFIGTRRPVHFCAAEGRRQPQRRSNFAHNQRTFCSPEYRTFIDLEKYAKQITLLQEICLGRKSDQLLFGGGKNVRSHADFQSRCDFSLPTSTVGIRGQLGMTQEEWTKQSDILLRYGSYENFHWLQQNTFVLSLPISLSDPLPPQQPSSSKKKRPPGTPHGKKDKEVHERRFVFQ